MFARLLWESFRRQKRRKALAGVAILMGVTVVTAMLALALSIGDRIHRELESYGANIVVTPTAEALQINLGGVELKPTTSTAGLREADLAKLKTIFWANNLNGISPELAVTLHDGGTAIPATGMWFQMHDGKAAAIGLHPWWKLSGSWPASDGEVVVGSTLAAKLGLQTGSTLAGLRVSGIVTAGDETDSQALLSLSAAQTIANLPGSVGRVLISARTKPEDAFARENPDTLSPKKREVWYCRPYANSIAYQIAEAIPGARAVQIRKVEQSQGQVLQRVSGLMTLIGFGAIIAAGFAVSAAMATAVLERQSEIGLMRSLGASRGRIAMLFYAESALLALLGGGVGYFFGSALASWMGARIFDDAATGLHLNPALLPAVVGVAILVAFAGSTPSIRAALDRDPSTTLRANA